MELLSTKLACRNIGDQYRLRSLSCFGYKDTLAQLQKNRNEWVDNGKSATEWEKQCNNVKECRHSQRLSTNCVEWRSTVTNKKRKRFGKATGLLTRYEQGAIEPHACSFFWGKKKIWFLAVWTYSIRGLRLSFLLSSITRILSIRFCQLKTTEKYCHHQTGKGRMPYHTSFLTWP